MEPSIEIKTHADDTGAWVTVTVTSDDETVLVEFELPHVVARDLGRDLVDAAEEANTEYEEKHL